MHDSESNVLFGKNPLIGGLASYCTLQDFPERLFKDPLKNISWRNIRPSFREILLEKMSEHYFPTPLALELAMSLQNAIFGSLMKRDPTKPSERARHNKVLSLSGHESLHELAPLTCAVSGGMLKAETGMGKSVTLKTILSVIAPEQIIIHKRSEACDWAQLVQIAYLYVEFPSNGSRGALAASIGMAIDKLLGTKYAEKIARTNNIDMALLLALKFVMMHRVGCIVIDEAQRELLGEGSWGAEFVRYFKTLMNFGVPVILSGHPMAFAAMEASGQLGRRFSGIGRFELIRAYSREEPWWFSFFEPGVHKFRVVESVRDSEIVRSEISKLSAGVPDFYCVLWRETQRIALRRGGDSAEVTVEDVGAAKTSPSFSALSEMSMWLEDPETTPGRYSDLTKFKPASTTPSLAKDSGTGSTPSPKLDSKRNPQLPDVVKKLQNEEKRRKSAKDKFDIATEKARALDEKDLRRGLNSQSISSSLDGLVQGDLDV